MTYNRRVGSFRYVKWVRFALTRSKETIAVTIDVDLIEEMKRIRSATDAPISRIVNRALRTHLDKVAS